MATPNQVHTLASLRSLLSDIWRILDEDGVQEVMINRENEVWVERHGVTRRESIKISNRQIESAIHLMGRLNSRDAKPNTKDSLIDARLDGIRIAAALSPISVFGSSICIRKHNPLLLTLDDYVTSGTLTEEAKIVVEELIDSHQNVLVVGGTSSGKTTFLNAMVDRIDPVERILTIEDTQELKVSAPNWVAFEANKQVGVNCGDLLKLCLRYRPDRILVGEVRAGEAYDLMQAANSGHDGVMASLHASSAKKGLTRMENLVLQADVNLPHQAIRQSISETFHAVIFLARRHGIRRVEQIVLIDDYDIVNHQYVFKQLYQAKELSNAKTEVASAKSVEEQEIA